MSISSLSDKSAVERAMAECDQIGREAFLDRYGFGKAKSYFLYHEGRSYDSKAIVGAAYGYEYPEKGPLKNDQFNGGRATVAPKLEELGFTVLRDAPVKPGASDPIVLTQAEVTAGDKYNWMDAEGERYHFPNNYRNRIVPGKRFVYYRGVRRKDGQRGTPEYFGTGVVGRVYRDDSVPESSPKRKWQWFCELKEYERFANPVPSKVDGEFIEKISQNLWGVAVRNLSQDQYENILSHASDAAPRAETKKLNKDPISTLLVEKPLLTNLAVNATGSRGRFYAPRDTKNIGDIAELSVYYFLEETLPKQEAVTLRWVAEAGEKPGWDIEYKSHGRLIAVEVKGTTGSEFPSFQLTANELNAIQRLRDNFRIALVAKVYSETPIIQFVDAPYKLVDSGEFTLTPLTYKVERYIP